MVLDRAEQAGPNSGCERVAMLQASNRMADEVHDRLNNSNLDFRASDGRPNQSSYQSALDTRANDPQAADIRRASMEPASVNERLASILNNRTNVTDKLAAVRELSHSGMSQISFKGADGQNYALRTETERLGSKEMVHLFITLPDGKERVVLRGIAKQDGSFEQERSSSGKKVDFYGKGAAYVLSNDSSSQQGPVQNRADRQRPDDRQQNLPDPRRAKPPVSEESPNPSLYYRYRREQDRREAPFNPFGDQTGSNNNGNDALGKIMNDAQRAANNKLNELIRTPQGVYMRARMDIDSDGSPRARQIDPTGQTRTSMRYTDGRSVNAEVVPYMVLPGGQYEQFGIKLGDMCLVRNRENGKMAVAVFADVGPRQKRGEGSMALASELGLNPSPTRGGTSKPNIEYLVLPGTGYPAKNQEQLLARIRAQGQRLGIG